MERRAICLTLRPGKSQHPERRIGVTGRNRHYSIAPDQQELVEPVQTVSHRVAGFLEREGILERDKENSYLNLEDGD